MKKTWRCFFCDVVLRSERAAREHFGASEMSTPACQIKGHEHGLVELIRRQEDELARYRAEDSGLLRTWRQRESEHAEALRREEEKGYERGIRDMKAGLHERCGRCGLPLTYDDTVCSCPTEAKP